MIISLRTPGGKPGLNLKALVASGNRLDFLNFEFQKPDCRTSKTKMIVEI